MLQTKTDLKISASLSQYFRCLTVYFLWKNLIECDRLPIIGSFCKQTLVFFTLFHLKCAFREFCLLSNELRYTFIAYSAYEFYIAQ